MSDTMSESIRRSEYPVVIFDEHGMIVYGFDALRRIASGDDAEACLVIRGIPDADVPELVLAATHRDAAA